MVAARRVLPELNVHNVVNAFMSESMVSSDTVKELPEDVTELVGSFLELDMGKVDKFCARSDVLKNTVELLTAYNLMEYEVPKDGSGACDWSGIVQDADKNLACKNSADLLNKIMRHIGEKAKVWYTSRGRRVERDVKVTLGYDKGMVLVGLNTNSVDELASVTVPNTRMMGYYLQLGKAGLESYMLPADQTSIVYLHLAARYPEVRYAICDTDDDDNSKDEDYEPTPKKMRVDGAADVVNPASDDEWVPATPETPETVPLDDETVPPTPPHLLVPSRLNFDSDSDTF